MLQWSEVPLFRRNCWHMIPSKAGCRSEFGGVGQALFPQTDRPGRGAPSSAVRPEPGPVPRVHERLPVQDVRRSRAKADHEVSAPSGGCRRRRPGVSGCVPHDSHSDGPGASPIVLIAALGRSLPRCPRSMKRARVWRKRRNAEAPGLLGSAVPLA